MHSLTMAKKFYSIHKLTPPRLLLERWLGRTKLYPKSSKLLSSVAMLEYEYVSDRQIM